MFEWFEQELREVQTPRFHVFDGPADEKLGHAIQNSSLPLPEDYREFARRFGNVRLYRITRTGYRVGVFAAPRQEVRTGEVMYHIGFHEGSRVYFKARASSPEFSVFETKGAGEQQVAGSFMAWFQRSCSAARTAYTKKKWAEIKLGPSPFSEQEEEIILARSQIIWQVLGIDSEGNHLFQVMKPPGNNLAVLTVGVRSSDRRLNGAIRLGITAIRPNESGIVRANCYKQLIDPGQIEVFPLPDPQPEDREFYWEFRGLDVTSGKHLRKRTYV